MRVLLVDDNVDAAETLAWLLREFGYDVETAHDGREGFRKFLMFAPDLAILDLGLPKLDGFALAQLIRDDSWVRTPTLVALSGYDTPNYRQRSHEAGFEYHLGKPADWDQIKRLLVRCELALDLSLN